ncbi:MAG TPA: hypothetical protein VLA95_00635 [Gemmatimonadales bacterium]|nr:hypothetical protein [Gemmatimonadales bacterium]
MFIELTDHLRCPAAHPESYLVLLPDAMAGRDVTAGRLGCPTCHAEYPVRDGVVLLGPPPDIPQAPARLDGPGLVALLGLDGPGGFVALVGGAAADWRGVAAALEAVHLVGVNPPEGIGPAPGFSVVLAPALPFKSRSLRGAALGPGYGDDPAWVAAAAAAVLPGLRVAGEGSGEGLEPSLEPLARAGGAWVARRRRA